MNMNIIAFNLLVAYLISLPTQAYYHSFIAENTATRRVRHFFHRILFTNQNANFIDRANNTNYIPRNPSHVLFIGTPNFIQTRTELANKSAINAKQKMISKKKTQEKIDQQLDKHAWDYATVTIPEWDRHNNVSMFLTSISRNGRFKGKKVSSKTPVDFNIVNSMKETVCNSTGTIKSIKLDENGLNYIDKVYDLNRFIGDASIHIKYFDPQCLISSKAKSILIEYKTQKGKPIFVTFDMNKFKSKIKGDYIEPKIIK